MPLLDDELRRRIPPLDSPKGETNPIVCARFSLPGTRRAWYIIAGESEGEGKDFLFFGFACEFSVFRLSHLEAIRGLAGARLIRDLTFTEGRLTDVVPAPDS